MSPCPTPPANPQSDPPPANAPPPPSSAAAPGEKRAGGDPEDGGGPRGGTGRDWHPESCASRKAGESKLTWGGGGGKRGK